MSALEHQLQATLKRAKTDCKELQSERRAISISVIFFGNLGVESCNSLSLPVLNLKLCIHECAAYALCYLRVTHKRQAIN